MKTTTYRNAILSIVGKGCLLFAAVGALVPSSVDAQCAQWDVSGTWQFTQNNNTTVSMDLRQNGKALTGKASYKVPGRAYTFNSDIPSYIETGSVDGTIAGNDFKVQIYWKNKAIGVYSGKVGPQGRIEGNNYDRQNPSQKTTWYSTTTMKCVDAAAAPAAPQVSTAPAAPKPNPAAPAKPAPPKPVKPTNARPPNWDVGGEWQLSQGDGKTVTLKLNENGGDLRGGATIGKPNAPGYTHGKVEGFVTADTFSARVTWAATIVTKADWVADYSGTINPQGMIIGTVNRGTPTQQNWSSLTAMKRDGGKGETADSSADPDPAGAAPDVARKPSGKGAPTISASSKVVAIPAGQAQGTTTLTWDGGADHPYAEVWVKVNDADEKFVVEKGKGTRTVNVQPGQTYTYILTDAGQRLATVTVKCN